jgi:hypothetical protein
LIGRGHARIVSELLTPLDIDPATPRSDAGISTSNKFRFGITLPEVVRIQLKYDLTRGQIIAYLYGAKASNNQVPEILRPFVDASITAAHEPYYVDAAPRADGRCMWCGLRFARQVSSITDSPKKTNTI